MVIIIFIVLFLLSALPVHADWPMAAANPQRTSYTSEQANPSPVEWYHVIEPFISRHIQPVVAATTSYPNGLVFVASSKGLYAIKADDGGFNPASNIGWRFDTYMPLNASPTVANNVVYQPGMDRKVYALNANTGAEIWETTQVGAGYDTNPLVVDNRVILGNRDGNLYAFNVADGSLSWQYTTGGPVRFSSAYKNGVVYTVSNDGFVYANNSTTGSLIWQSQTNFPDGQMRGDGFNSYWPVVYTDPNTSTDYIVVVSSSPYRNFIEPGEDSLKCGADWHGCQWWELFNGGSLSLLGTTVNLNESWVNGRTVESFWDTVMEYYANPTAAEDSSDPAGLNRSEHKPWRRPVYIFRATNGTEYSMPSKSGTNTYAPVVPCISGSGNPYPPVVGQDNLLYFCTLRDNNNQAFVYAWKFGTQYFASEPLQSANDEPPSLSAGGSLIYRSICCDRDGSAADINGVGAGSFWIYNLDSKAPGYDTMWWFPSLEEARLYGNYGRLSTAMGGTASTNGLYHEHGDNSPIVPFHNRAYTLNSNALIAWGPAGGARRLTQITSIDVPSVPDTSITQSTLLSRLESEVQKIIAAGHLRPGYFNHGQINATAQHASDYFIQPGDTILALSRAYPYLNTTLQSQVKTYLHTELNRFETLNWQGTRREWLPTVPDVQVSMDAFDPTNRGLLNDKYQTYSLWKYYQIADSSDRSTILSKAQAISGTNSVMYWDNLPELDTNRNLIGDFGWSKLNGGTATTINSCPFTKNSPWTSVNGYVKRVFNISRNFFYMVPEMSNCYRNNITAINSAINEYTWLAPFWFVSRYTDAIGETTNQHLYDYPSMFAAKAYIQQLPKEELVKYIDVPAFKVGDLFYIQNLIAAIEAPSSGGGSPTPTSSTSTPSPTPSTSGPPGNPSDWVLTFSDEFDGSALDTSKWSTKYPASSGRSDRTNNNELQWYVNDAQNLTGGVLSLTANRQSIPAGRSEIDPAIYNNSNLCNGDYSGSCTDNGAYSSSTYPYTSGMISSANKFSQKYGYFEARMKIPNGVGMWPAFWLMPQAPSSPPTPWPWTESFWPPEIDIMENKQTNASEVSNIWMNNIYSASYPIPGGVSNNWNPDPNWDELWQTSLSGDTTDYSAAYHTFGLDWEANSMTFYIDGVARHTTPTNHIPPGTLSPGEMFIIANLAIGDQAGDPSGTTFPKSLDVDYIRVYQKVSSVQGDANGDGHVDGVDYVIWLNHYDTSSQGPPNGDFDNNNIVDGVDYVIWLNNYGV